MGVIDEAVQAMVDHSNMNPRHGYNCACKDKFVRQVRLNITEEQQRELAYLAKMVCSGPVRGHLRPVN